MLLKFRGAINGILESAKKRGFSIKVGGNELTFEEASEQQRTQIADLQKQVLNLKSTSNPTSLQKENVTKILWVDDKPSNNSYQVAYLKDLGITVDLALTTDDALEQLEKKNYDRIISDMGRKEGGSYVRDAGIKLTEQVRKTNKNIPIVIFSSSRGMKMRDLAIGKGANEVTNSSTILYEALSIETDSNKY